MKSIQMIKVLTLAFIFILATVSSSQAVLFRMLDAKSLGRAASTSGSMAFKGKVLKIEETAGSRNVTLQVQDVIKGNAKAGEVITLQFPNLKFSNNMRLSMGIPPPEHLEVGAETVLFTTTRLDGKTLLIGGEQGQYYLSNEGGKTGVYNALGNSNFFSGRELNNSLMKKVMQGMQERNSGTIPYEDFKKLINQ